MVCVQQETIEETIEKTIQPKTAIEKCAEGVDRLVAVYDRCDVDGEGRVTREELLFMLAQQVSAVRVRVSCSPYWHSR